MKSRGSTQGSSGDVSSPAGMHRGPEKGSCRTVPRCSSPGFAGSDEEGQLPVRSPAWMDRSLKLSTALCVPLPCL